MKQSEKTAANNRKTHRLVKQIRLIDVINLAVIMLIVGYASWALFYPFKLIEVKNLTSEGKIPIVEKRVQAGTYVKYRIKSERHTGDTITVIRSLVNGQTIPFSANLSNRLPGVSEFVVETLLPANLNPGKYNLRICYQADFPLDRTVVNCYDTERFEVFLPAGVDPNSDGIVVPNTGNIPSIQNDIPLDAEPGGQGTTGGTRSTPVQPSINYVEPPDVQERTEQQESAQSSGQTANGNQPSGLCRLLSIDSDLLLPIRIC